VRKQTLKYGGNDTVLSVSLFLVDGVKVSKLQCSSTANDEALAGFDQNLEIAWGEWSSLEGANVEAFSEFYAKKIFDRILTINNKGDNSVLHVVLHFPLYKPEALETVKWLYNAIDNAGRPTEIDFMGYCDDIADIIEPNFTIESPSSKQIAAFAQFKEEQKIAFNRHFFAIQNASQNGISLGLNSGSLGDVIGRFAMLCVDYYDEIFPNTVEYKDVVSFGLSTLYLDKYLFVEYLLGKTMLHAMDNAEVNNNEVDVNHACNAANLLLKDKTALLSGLYERMDASVKDTEEFPKIQQQFEEEIAQIIEKCKEIFQVNKSITTRAAILAAILSKTECELFSKTIFNHDAVNMDNLFNEPVDYFIDHDKIGFYKLDQKPVVNPICELKDLNNKLINSETEIRDLQEQLASLERQISDVQKVEDCFIEDGFFHFHDQKFRLLPSLEQEPLTETYTAHETTIPNIDLRQNFNSIKNQGQQGSCLAHAVTSIFEYAMKLNQLKEFDLSEAFLYYNAREMDATGDVSIDTDTGSRFKPAMDSLARYGIALEKFCPYNENVYNQKPGDEAYRDAASRRLISAKNVNRKVFDIKSALVDGYPVAASFTLCPSFKDTSNGYIPMPGEQEIAEMFAGDASGDKHFRHTMVITGFSDELQMFVVRNSWGEDWGDGGYCYIPYSYLENEKLCDFACMIAEIEQLSIPKMERVPALKIDDTDLNTKYIIVNNSLKKETREAESNRKRSDWLRAYFERIKKLLSAPNQRDEFIARTKERLAQEQEEIRKIIHAKKGEQEVELEKFNRYKKQVIIKSASFVFGTVFFFALYNKLLNVFSNAICWFWDSGCEIKISWFWVIACLTVIAGFLIFRKSFIKHFGLSLGVVGGLLALNAVFTMIHLKFDFTLSYWWLIPVLIIYGGVIIYWGNKRWRDWRDHRDELDEEIRGLNQEIAARDKAINNFKIKTFAAWALLKALEKTQTHFQFLYGNMISLINNLRTWYEEVSGAKENSQLETATPNTSLLNADILDAFFNDKLKEDAAFDIDLCEGIENHKIEEGYLKRYKETLFDHIARNLLAVKELHDFDISTHAVNNRFSGIARPITRNLIDDVDNKSGLFLNISSNERGIIVPSTGIYAPSLNLFKDDLRKKLGKYSEPYFESNDKYRLVFLKTATLWFRECVNLKSEK
jgi:C1A family cysteine protease